MWNVSPIFVIRFFFRWHLQYRETVNEERVRRTSFCPNQDPAVFFPRIHGTICDCPTPGLNPIASSYVPTTSPTSCGCCNNRPGLRVVIDYSWLKKKKKLSYVQTIILIKWSGTLHAAERKELATPKLRLENELRGQKAHLNRHQNVVRSTLQKCLSVHMLSKRKGFVLLDRIFRYKH